MAGITRIIGQFERVAAGLVERAARLPPAILGDTSGRRGAMHGRIAALSPEMRCAGPALTVDVRPGDNLMIHAALALAKAGDVLVVDGKGDQSCALFGAILAHACRERGIAGVVIDAAVRDRQDIVALGFPVFCVGANPKGPTKGLAGTVNRPISAGGIAVRPGDFVTADGDGVVVVERELLGDLLPMAERKVLDEDARMAAIREGRLDMASLPELLRSAGLDPDELNLFAGRPAVGDRLPT